jgi:hypothetical protein
VEIKPIFLPQGVGHQFFNFVYYLSVKIQLFPTFYSDPKPSKEEDYHKTGISKDIYILLRRSENYNAYRNSECIGLYQCEMGKQYLWSGRL